MCAHTDSFLLVLSSIVVPSIAFGAIAFIVSLEWDSETKLKEKEDRFTAVPLDTGSTQCLSAPRARMSRWRAPFDLAMRVNALSLASTDSVAL